MRAPASGLFRRVMAQKLVHRYTRTPMTDGAVNDHNEATSVPGTPVTGVVCLYETKDVFISDEQGDRTVSTPTLRVLPADPLAVDDQVSDILDAASGVLLAGPLTVQSIDEGAQAGTSVLRTATLHGTDIRRGG